jgi:hypothetical protein
MRFLVSAQVMENSRSQQAIARIEAALSRIAATGDAARQPADPPPKVIELINTHEKLRENVADALRDLDALIEQLEG